MRVMKNLPKVSIVLCTFNGEKTLRKCLDSILSQDYPREKIEILIADGGSEDGTLDIIKEYVEKYPKIVSYRKNLRRYSEGKGKGKDLTSKEAKGEIIAFIDQDNILVQKNWMKEMTNILIKNPDISGVQSRMAIPKHGRIIDKYLSAIGIEDPFAIPYSLNAQIVLTPWRFLYNKEGEFYIYKVNRKRFLYAGNNGFLIKRKEFFENGGYTQDTDNFYRMALKNYKIAVPKNLKLHHKASATFSGMIKKRDYYINHYLTKNYETRDWFWFDLKRNDFNQNLRFIKTVLFNLAFIPGLLQASELMLRRREIFWIIHPFVLFVVTADYFKPYLRNLLSI